ncbi:cation transporting ATPase C-terminal domain-containing protein, partial [Patescibacteria group bacterium]|nr:cation transporting ATPase C-terminal domain-containing protein [Patescibacteria group bacterium]
EGRILFDNIRKVVIFLLSDAFEEIALVVAAIALKLPLPILATQILWINLISDGPAAIALAFESGERDVMKLPPREKDEPIVNGDIRLFIILLSGITAFTLIFVFLLMYYGGWEIEIIRTFIYTTLGIDTLLYVFSVRTLRTPIWRSRPLQNKWLIGAVLIGFVFLLTPLLIEPFKTWFEFTSMTLVQWVAAIGLALYELILIEVGKMVLNRRFQRKIKQNKKNPV